MDITLALGGGGTRGASHIGVLRVLEREGFHIRALAGTSVGSVVAALYASGKSPDRIEEIFSGIDQSKFYGWPLSDGPGFLGVRSIAEFFKTNLGATTFEDLKLPCAVVVVDLNSNREIIFQKGCVMDALLGSIAVPGLFPPKEIDSYLLVDGGALDPVPVRAARAFFPNLPVVAVTLMSPLDLPATPIGIVSFSVSKTLVKQFTRLNITQAFRIFAASVDIGSRQMAELRLALDAPAVIVRPDVNGINLLDKVDVAEIARRGERAAEAILPELRRAVSWRGRLARALNPPGR